MTSQLPANWSEQDLGSISVILDNRRVPLSAAQRSGRSGPYPYCGANGVLDYIDDFMIDDDVILLAEDGGNFDQYASRPIAYRMQGRMWVNNHAHVLKAANGETGFLFYSLEHKDITRYISSGTRSKLTRGELVRIKVALTKSISEQRHIGDTLGDVDDLIAALERSITERQAIKQGTMQELLRGRTRLPGFDGPWDEGPLKLFLPLQRGFDLPTSEVTSGPHPVVYSNGVSRTHAVAMAKGPGVITGRSGTIGKVHFVSEDYWPHNTTLWVTSFARVDPKFAYYFLTHLGLKRFASGSGVPTFNRNDAHGFMVSVPSKRAEQVAIAEVLTDADREIESLGRTLAKAQDIKQGMMQELLTGRTRLPVREIVA